MSLIVGKIANKFWSNSEYKFPNGFPVYEEQEELKDVEPNMNNFVTGTVYLFGDKWNHCIYNGAYYSLYILEVIDEERKFYTYRLERDFWFDVLKLRPTVVGDLVTSNNDEILEKNINRTIAAIDNPARVITINFGEVDFDWRKNIDIRTAETEIPQKVLALKDFNRFLESADCVFASKWKDIDKTFYSKSRNPAVFLLDLLRPSIIYTGWKNLIRNKVNEFIKSIPRTAKTELKLAKLSLSGTNAGSPLNGKYCITSKSGGIESTSESENYRIKTIDLSELKDIVPINLHDLQEITPFTNLLRGDKSGLFNVVDVAAPSEKFFAKIKRKAYVPICATPDRRPEDVGFGFTGNWNNVKNPQKIIWEYGGEKKEDFLWWIDNVNFVIQKTGYDLETTAANRSTGPRTVKDYWFPKIMPLPVPWTAPYWDYDEIFPELTDKQFVSLGFFIYGINRDSNLWFLFEYIGTKKLRQVEYFSGIKKDFVETYRAPGSWWSDLKGSFSKLKKSDELLKFYLDTSWLSLMAVLPGTYYESAAGLLHQNYPSYLYEDIWGTYEMTKYRYYVPQLLVSDIYDAEGNSIALNPFNPARFSGFQRDKEEKFRKVLNYGVFNMPENMEIETGDYFFSDLDYEIETRFVWELGKEKGRDWARFANRELKHDLAYLRGKPAWEFAHQLRLEDFVKNEQGTSILKVEEGESFFALCTTLCGNMDVRKMQGFSRTLFLSSDKNEIVKEVEGAKSQKVHFTLMKKLSDPLIPEQGEYRITDQIKAKLIKGFYEALDYKVIGEGEVFWNWFNEADFAPNSQTQHLFDLVGTDWYVHIAKGKISLICKDENILESTEKKLNTLLYHENENLNLSLTAKINQKARLQFFTAPYYLNWKTTFTDEDRIFLYSSLIKPTKQKTEFEQYFLRLETQFDRIWYENISIPKKVDKALELADSVRVQGLHMQLIRDQYQYQIDQDRLDLATKRYEESIKRSTIELENQRKLSLISAATTLLTGGIGLGALTRLYKPSVLTKGRKTNIGVYKLGGIPTRIPETEENAEMRSYMKKIGHFHEGVHWTKGGFPKHAKFLGAGSFGINSMINMTKNLITDFAIRFPEMERQIGVEKQLGAEDLGISSLTINTNHMDRQVTAQQQLNQVANVYTNPGINEREVLDQFREKKEWHGKKLNDVYLVVFVPTEEQLVALESYREEFGVMCDIPNIKMNFYEGMEPDIVRYRNLDDEAIRGIENLIIREFFKSHLMAGIKIIKTEKHTYKLLDSEEYRQQIFRLNKDLYAKDEAITTLRGEVERTKETCNTQRTELQKQIDSIENQLNNVNTQLNQKVKELEAKEKECAESKKKLEEETKKHKIDKEEAEQKWDDCKRDYLNEKTAKNALAKEKEELTKQLAEYDQDKKRLEWNRKELTKKRKELEDMTKEKDEAQAKVTTLEGEKAKLEEQKAALIRDYEQERDDRLSALGELRNCEAEKEKLNKQIEELKDKKAELEEQLKAKSPDSAAAKQAEEYKKQKELLETQKADIERQLREALAAKTQLETQKAEVQKKFEDCKRNRQQQKTQLEGKIKELQKKIEDNAAKAAETPAKESPEVCILFKKLLTDSTIRGVDLKRRIDANDAKYPDKGNALRDLIMQVIEETRWMRKADLDGPLGTKYKIMRPIFEAIERFERVPLVALWIEARESEGWYEYKKAVEESLLKKESFTPNGWNTKLLVDRITGVVPTASNTESTGMENEAAALAVKAALDELNWLTYKAKEQLKEQIKTDSDLSYFFAHIYPGDALSLYTEVFGDFNIALAKRRFLEEITCGEQTTATSAALLDLVNKTKYLTDDLTRQQDRKPPAPTVPYFDGFITTNLDRIDSSFSPLRLNWIQNVDRMITARIYKSRYYWTERFPGDKDYFSFVYAKFERKGEEEYGAYIFVEKENLWASIMGTRNFLWQNRKKIRVPENLEEYEWTREIRANMLIPVEEKGKKVIKQYPYELAYINLKKIFGPEYVVDAAILLAILRHVTIAFNGYKKEPDAEGYYWYKFTEESVDIMAAHKNEFQFVSDIFSYTEFPFWMEEFPDTESLLNYIWRQIKLGHERLEDPFSSIYTNTKKFDFPKFLNEIWKANQ